MIDDNVELNIDGEGAVESVFIGYKMQGGIFVLAEREPPVTAKLEHEKD